MIFLDDLIQEGSSIRCKHDYERKTSRERRFPNPKNVGRKRCSLSDIDGYCRSDFESYRKYEFQDGDDVVLGLNIINKALSE